MYYVGAGYTPKGRKCTDNVDFLLILMFIDSVVCVVQKKSMLRVYILMIEILNSLFSSPTHSESDSIRAEPDKKVIYKIYFK